MPIIMTVSQGTNDSLQSDNQDLRDYLRPVWAHKLLILVLVVVATAGAYTYYNGKPRIYTTSTNVFVGDPAGGDTGFAPSSDRALQNQARLLRTRAVAARVAKKIRFEGDPGFLLGYVNATAAQGTDFLTITSTGGNPQLVATLANEFAQAFIDMRASAKRDQLRKQLAALEEQLAGATGPDNLAFRRSIRGRINQLELAAVTPSGDAQQLDEAFPPAAPISPNPRRNAIFAFALSLLLGIIAAFGLERVNRRIRSTEEAERAFRLPIIASIAHERDIASSVDGRASVSDSVRESFRSLRSNLELISARRPLKTILVTSAVSEEGKSTVTRNLALVYAEAGLRVAVIDADLRRPSLARLFNTEGGSGLADVLMGLQPLEAVVQTISAHAPAPVIARKVAAEETHGDAGVAVMPATNGHGDPTEAVARLHFIASGPRPADPPAMFSAPSMAALLARVAEDHDIVLVDSPPLLAVSDAMPLLSIVDGALLVCRLGVSSVDGAERVTTVTSRVPEVRLLGVVVNDVDVGFGDGYGAY
jgi:succinoglycan biosynthesis transport protein ExoP